MKKLKKLTLKELENSVAVMQKQSQMAIVAGSDGDPYFGSGWNGYPENGGGGWDSSGFGGSSSPCNPVSLAYYYLGTKEVAGKESNPDILSFFSATNAGTPKDDSTVGWCSAFANYCIYNSGGVGTNSALASSWLTWGNATNSPRPGDVAVAKDGSHVGIVESINSDGSVKIISGNYSNSVAESNVSSSDYSFRTKN